MESWEFPCGTESRREIKEEGRARRISSPKKERELYVLKVEIGVESSVKGRIENEIRKGVQTKEKSGPARAKELEEGAR